MEKSENENQFSYQEQIAILLYKTSNKKVHYETYVLTQINTDLEYKYEYHQKTFEFLVKRHENLRAYFKFNEKMDTYERVYDNDYVPKALPLIILNENATDENIERIFLEHYDKNYSIEKLPGIKVCFIRAPNGLFSVIRGHHCYLEVETAKILHREGLNLYAKIFNSAGNITYEEAIKDLPILPSYIGFVDELNSNLKRNSLRIADQLRNALKNYREGDKANAAYVGTEYFQNKFRVDLTKNGIDKFLTKVRVRPHQLFKAAYQICISKILGTNIPLIFNVNSRRNSKWKNNVLCNLKNHPFYVEVDEGRTLEEQIKHNEEKNKEILKVWGPLDAYLCQANTSETFPVSQYVFNFVYNDEEQLVFRPDLRKETQIDSNYPMNIYFEVYYRPGEWANFFFISKLISVSEENTKKMKSLLMNIIENIECFWEKQIQEF